MRRKYLTDLYTDRVNTIKRLMPEACIGVDVIVGFPGETEEEFLKTVVYLKELPISYLHVFTYSERANTTAKKMADAVPINIRRERSRQLQILSEKKRRAFYETQLGKSESVLFEAEESGGVMNGFSSNYVKVKTPFNPALINQTVQVKFESIDLEGTVRVELLEQIIVV